MDVVGQVSRANMKWSQCRGMRTTLQSPSQTGHQNVNLVPQEHVTACPWHRFWDQAAAKGLSAAAMREHYGALQTAAAARPLLSTAAAGVLSPLLLAACTAKGRRAVLATLDTALASVLLVCLLGVVLGLPVGALYLLCVAGGYLLRFVAASIGLT